MSRKTPFRPERLRTMERPFGWAPCRLLTEGILCRLSLCATSLYFALCLAADRRGLSYWSDERLAAKVGLDENELLAARNELIQRDLVDFDGSAYQVLSLPKGAVRRPSARRIWKPQRPERDTDPEHIRAVLAPVLDKLRST